MRRPAGVMPPAASIAPSSPSSAFAAAKDPDGGRSWNGRSEGGVPQAAQSNAREDNSASKISGRSKAGMPRCRAGDQRRIATPEASRPERPARWSAAAREMRRVVSRVSPVAGSRRGARRQPPSTTIRTPGTVSEVSAIEVAKTTRLVFAGVSALSCSARGSSPCNGKTSAPQPSSAVWVRRISAMPGRKARISPLCSMRAERIARAIASGRSRGRAMSRAW